MIYETLKSRFRETAGPSVIMDAVIKIKAKALTPEESLGNPFHDDYPLVKGKEKLVQADYRGFKGVAFTDMYGDHEASLSEILEMDLRNNFRRAILISAINAVLRSLGLADKTEHCRDEGLLNCASCLKEYIGRHYPGKKILLVGFQPRFAETLAGNFDARIVDRAEGNVGKDVKGTKVSPEDDTGELIEWADMLFVTGSTFVNGTAEKFMNTGRETVFYGVTCAGPAYLLGLKRFCPEGR
ncbi:MAG: hypothetical protein JXJ19_04485 [Elusimicrobia bacterium]|nr:hypothetical protein [Elusimicrobiota bacterium]